MPTGYTDTIKDGITFKEFAIKCARAFGACIEMRDEPADAPIPDKFEPSNYHSDAFNKAKEKLSKVSNMSLGEATKEADKEFKNKESEYKKSIDKNKILEKKYRAMLYEVNMWIPPTAEHIGMKKFMIEQIEGSIDFDCGDYYERALKELKKLTGAEWIQKETDSAIYDLVYHAEQKEKEISRVNNRTEWVKALRESLI